MLIVVCRTTRASRFRAGRFFFTVFSEKRAPPRGGGGGSGGGGWQTGRRGHNAVGLRLRFETSERHQSRRLRRPATCLTPVKRPLQPRGCWQTVNKADHFAACNFYLFLRTYVSLTPRSRRDH